MVVIRFLLTRDARRRFPAFGVRIFPVVNTLRLRSMARLALACAACAGAACPSRAFSTRDQVTAISARASDDYVRATLPEGGLKPEYYAFAEGGHWTGAVSDASIDGLKFIEVARAIAGPLKDQAYLPARDAQKTNLLIVVYWGRTRTAESTKDSMAVQNLAKESSNLAGATGSLQQKQIAQADAIGMSGPGMVCGHIQASTDFELINSKISADNSTSSAMAVVSAGNSQRDQVDARNALMLGFDTAWKDTEGLAGTPLAHRREDLIMELEQQRYFVVLMAYDFQLMWKEKKHKLLWETRYSVPERGTSFDKYLVSMTRRASQYFGRNSRGLMHLDLPEGHVEVGEVKSLGALP